MKDNPVLMAIAIVVGVVILLPALGVSITATGISAGMLVAVLLVFWGLNQISGSPLWSFAVVLISFLALVYIFGRLDLIQGGFCNAKGEDKYCVNAGKNTPLFTKNGKTIVFPTPKASR